MIHESINTSSVAHDVARTTRHARHVTHDCLTERNKFPAEGTSCFGLTPPTSDNLQHSDHSGEKLTYFDPNLGENYVPHVIEPAAVATRSMMAFLLAAYDEETVNDDLRTVLRFDERIAPYKVAILPLSKKDTLTPIAQEVFDLVKAKWMTDYDETQNIGKRYRRQDELGTPYCVTIDFETIDDKAVTIRDRDTMQQDRIAIDQLVTYLGDRLT